MIFLLLIIIFWYTPTPRTLVAQRIKRLPATQETWVRSLGQEDPLEKEMATHSSILAGTPGGYSLWGLRELDKMTEHLNTFTLGFPGGSDGLKNLPATQETWVRSLGREDPLEKGMAIHSNILAWRISWTEEPGGYSPWSCRVVYYWASNTSIYYLVTHLFILSH